MLRTLITKKNVLKIALAFCMLSFFAASARALPLPLPLPLPHLEGNIIFPGNTIWDYSPSWMVDQFDYNKEKMWWCSESNGTDVIRYSEKSQQGVWSTPKIVFAHTANAPSWEGVFVCDPSVVRGAFSVRLTPNGPLQNFSYAMYYTTNDPVTNNNPSNNRVGVAFSNDGVNWQRYYNYVIHKPSYAYGSGQQVAFNTNGGSSIGIVYTFVESFNKIYYYYSLSNDGVNFGAPQPISTQGLSVNGLPGVSLLAPALAFAPVFEGQQYYYYLANVCKTYGGPDQAPKSVCVYRIPMTNLSQGVWERIVDPGDVKPVEFEPGFRADAWGWMSGGLLSPVTLGMGCSGAHGADYVFSYEICYGVATP